VGATQKIVCLAIRPPLSLWNVPKPRVRLHAMNLREFRDSLRHDNPSKELGLALVGLWWDARGDWAKAHQSAQQDKSLAGAWVHAYLHRKEGDPSNAAYWYQRADKAPSRSSLQEEWEEISASLLS
jgi:hypothetical protein